MQFAFPTALSLNCERFFWAGWSYWRELSFGRYGKTGWHARQKADCLDYHVKSGSGGL
jgi:hypothetical protein